MKYKKLNIETDDQGRKRAGLKETVVGDIVAIKLHKFTEPIEKQINWNGKTFPSVSIVCMHGGEEILLNLTPSIGNKMKEYKPELGQDYTISAVQSKNGKTPKIYLLYPLKEEPFTDEHIAVAREIYNLANEKGVVKNEVDFYLVEETLQELNKMVEEADKVYSAFLTL